MAWFIPFILLLAIAWGVVGILLAKWLKQAGHNKPLKGRHLEDSEVYGGGVGFGREVGLGGSEREMDGMARGGVKGRTVGMGGAEDGDV